MSTRQKNIIILTVILEIMVRIMPAFSQAERTVAPGDPVGELKISVDIGEESTWYVGETYTLRVNLTNVSDEALIVDVFGGDLGQTVLIDGSDVMNFSNWSFTFIPCGGAEVVNRTSFSKEDFVIIDPQESYLKELTCTLEDTKTPWTYDITYETRLSYISFFIDVDKYYVKIKEAFSGNKVYRGGVLYQNADGRNVVGGPESQLFKIKVRKR